MINTINNKKFQTANEAYEYLHNAIIQHGVEFDNTKALFNVGFYITNPLANTITNKNKTTNNKGISRTYWKRITKMVFRRI